MILLAFAFVSLINSSSIMSVYLPCDISTFLNSIRLLMTAFRSSGFRYKLYFAFLIVLASVSFVDSIINGEY